jgi:transposase
MACYNCRRSLLTEFDIVLLQKVACLRREICAHREVLPGYANLCVGDLLNHTAEPDTTIAEYDRAIAQAARESERSRRLMQLSGIGPVTASALLVSLGHDHDFRNGRHVAALDRPYARTIQQWRQD